MQNLAPHEQVNEHLMNRSMLLQPYEIQKHIQTLEEHKQGTPLPPTLLDFLTEDVLAIMLGLRTEKRERNQIQEEESNDDDRETCNVVVYGGSSSSNSDDEEVIFVKTKKPECQAVLLSGTNIPERQPPPEDEAGKSKAKAKGK